MSDPKTINDAVKALETITATLSQGGYDLLCVVGKNRSGISTVVVVMPMTTTGECEEALNELVAKVSSVFDEVPTMKMPVKGPAS